MKNLIVGPIFGPFWSKKLQSKGFLKNSFVSNLSLYAAVTLLRNSIKKQKRPMHWLFIIPEKLYYGPFRAPFGPKTLKLGFSKKSFKSILSFYPTKTGSKKSENFHLLTFDYAWKTLFWDPITLKPGQNDYEINSFYLSSYWIN